MMDALTAILKRRSVRTFRPEPLPKDMLEKIVDAGRLAPTARNEQPWQFVVITEPQRLKALGELTDYGKFIAGAPACIAVVCRDTKYYLEDGCAATENILIAATALGFGSCWVAGEKKMYALAVLKLLAVPPGYNLVSLIPLGYADGGGKPVPKRDPAKVVHWEKF
jgi:nitroreductase